MRHGECRNCKFWLSVAGDEGTCRRQSPQIVVMETKPGKAQKALAMWPTTKDTDGCAEFKPVPSGGL